MITKRIIPCLDVKDGQVVKGIHFKSLTQAGDPVELASKYDQDGADELVFLDITATNEHRQTVINMVEKVAENIFIPFTVGGGISSLDQIRNILRAGADKVSINSAAVRNPDFLTQASESFGNQCIVLAVDGKMRTDKSGWNVMINGGRIDTGIDALDWIEDGVRKGAGEILLTSMDADGTKKGFDLPFLKEVKKRVNVPVIASGGGGSLEDFYEVFTQNAADAALAASVFHYGELTITEVKKYLKLKGVNVRL